MCTIMTFDKAKFDANKEEIIKRIQQDFSTNSHGSSLIIQGATDKDTMLQRSLNIDFLLATLTAAQGWQRFWLHNRMATGTFRGLPGAHGFHARFDGKDYYVMHNGIFSHQESNRFAVDSEWLADLVRRYGPKSALTVINNNERYANCFLICPTEGEWYMSRASNGQLHTDGAGNFSTNEVLDLKTDVPDQSLLKLTLTVTKAPAYTGYYGGSSHSGNERGHGRSASSSTPASSGSTTTARGGTAGSAALSPSQLQEGKWVKQGSIFKKKVGDVIYVTKTPDQKEIAS